MSPRQRDLVLMAYNGDDRTLPFLYQLTSHVAFESILIALINQGLTGQNLSEIIQIRCNNEPLKFLKFCLTKLHKAKNPDAPKARNGLIY